MEILQYIDKNGILTKYEGYLIDEDGNVFTTKRNRLLTRNYDSKGYQWIKISVNSKTICLKLHRCVQSTYDFNGYFEGAEVNHKDEDKTNNNINNLEWCTPQYNHNYGTRNIRAGKSLINGNNSKPVLQYDLYGNLIKEWPSANEIKRELGLKIQHICEVCRGDRKTAYGYIWRYKN